MMKAALLLRSCQFHVNAFFVTPDSRSNTNITGFESQRFVAITGYPFVDTLSRYYLT